MNAQEAIAYIEDYTWSTTRLGLERTRALLSALGDPQKKLKFIHVTGSNGKGSTCAILDSILRKAGYRTGLYTSPYLVRFNERIKVNGREIPDEALAAITSQVRVFADMMEDHPSQFELVTAIAMEYFYEMHCDIVVLEVGMGGALDSTNAIDAPEVAVFTNIGLEHTEYLGNTIEEIAATKGGIIKPGCDCVAYPGPAETTLRAICTDKDVPFLLSDFDAAEPVAHSLDGQELKYKGKLLFFPLLGHHQINNLCVALDTVYVLKKRGWNIPSQAIEDGVASVNWPARFQVLSREPLFILDGGHNPQCAEAMAEILDDYLPDTKVTFIMGVLADKDYNSMLDSVCPHASRFVCVTPDSPRALPADRLAEIVRERGFNAVVCDSVPDAVKEACSADDDGSHKKSAEPIVAFGSLYMSGSVLKYFEDR